MDLFFTHCVENVLVAPVSNPVDSVVVLDAGLVRCKRESLCVQTDLLSSGACLYNFDTRLAVSDTCLKGAPVSAK